VPKFLFCGSYSPEGIRRLGSAGASGERKRLEKVIGDAGGVVETLYWAFGERDLYLVADLPSSVAAGGVTLAVGGAGELKLTTVFLETVDEVQAALDSARHLSP
jgi:uncharacterized protein with GYD domain